MLPILWYFVNLCRNGYNRNWKKTCKLPASNNKVLRTRNCTHALGEPAGSRRTLLQRAASGRHGRRLESIRIISKMTSSIDAYLLEEQSCQISPRSDLKRRTLAFLWRGSHQNNSKKRNNNTNKTNSDMELVPDQKYNINISE